MSADCRCGFVVSEMGQWDGIVPCIHAVPFTCFPRRPCSLFSSSTADCRSLCIQRFPRSFSALPRRRVILDQGFSGVPVEEFLYHLVIVIVCSSRCGRLDNVKNLLPTYLRTVSLHHDSNMDWGFLLSCLHNIDDVDSVTRILWMQRNAPQHISMLRRSFCKAFTCGDIFDVIEKVYNKVRPATKTNLDCETWIGSHDIVKLSKDVYHDLLSHVPCKAPVLSLHKDSKVLSDACDNHAVDPDVRRMRHKRAVEERVMKASEQAHALERRMFELSLRHNGNATAKKSANRKPRDPKRESEKEHNLEKVRMHEASKAERRARMREEIERRESFIRLGAAIQNGDE